MKKFLSIAGLVGGLMLIPSPAHAQFSFDVLGPQGGPPTGTWHAELTNIGVGHWRLVVKANSGPTAQASGAPVTEVHSASITLKKTNDFNAANEVGLSSATLGEGGVVANAALQANSVTRWRNQLASNGGPVSSLHIVQTAGDGVTEDATSSSGGTAPVQLEEDGSNVLEQDLFLAAGFTDADVKFVRLQLDNSSIAWQNQVGQSSVPEPASITLAMAAFGPAGLALLKRRRRSSQVEESEEA